MAVGQWSAKFKIGILELFIIAMIFLIDRAKSYIKLEIWDFGWNDE
jgi:hypothetical protein